MPDRDTQLRDLPAVDKLAARLDVTGLSQAEVVSIAREAIDFSRRAILEGSPADVDQIASDLVRAALTARVRPVINATGVLLHTNLGRAPLAPEAAAAATAAASGYSNIEFDLLSGSRGRRGSHTARLLQTLTGAEDALVVNNNAAGLFLVLAALGDGTGVPVSRGELIEIGGSYRLPELMAASGARLIEVGTTNRTRSSDYATALQINHCEMILKVHRANYEISGFVEEASLDELVEVAKASQAAVVFDIGSGLLDATTPWLEEAPGWLDGEPGVLQSLNAGADLALFSGDKLVGGPQAGIVVGRGDLISKMRAHPIRRALRVDGPTDAALAATLQMYSAGRAREIPFWEMATKTYQELENRLERLAQIVGATVEDSYSMVGGGSAPTARIPSPVVRIEGGQDIYERLLDQEVPIVTRRDRGDLVLDVRCVPAILDDGLLAAVARCL